MGDNLCGHGGDPVREFELDEQDSSGGRGRRGSVRDAPSRLLLEGELATRRSPPQEGSRERRTRPYALRMLDRFRTSPRVFPLVAAPVLGVLGVVEAAVRPRVPRELRGALHRRRLVGRLVPGRRVVAVGGRSAGRRLLPAHRGARGARSGRHRADRGDAGDGVRRVRRTASPLDHRRDGGRGRLRRHQLDRGGLLLGHRVLPGGLLPGSVGRPPGQPGARAQRAAGRADRPARRPARDRRPGRAPRRSAPGSPARCTTRWPTRSA